MDERIDEDLQSSLNMLCLELQIFLTRTEMLLSLSQHRFEQAQNVVLPWVSEKESKSEQVSCVCKSFSNMQISDQNDDSTALMDSVTKTLKNAQSLRASKTTSKLSQKKSTNLVTKKSSSSNTTKSKTTASKTKTTPNTSKESISHADTHNPSCPLYDLDKGTTSKKSSLSLSTVISSNKVPPVLTKTLRQCSKILIRAKSEENSPNSVPKHKFLECLEQQNDEYLKNVDDEIKISFPKYISALHSFEAKKKISCDSPSWLTYSHINDLEIYQKYLYSVETKTAWNKILKSIICDVIPNLRMSDLDMKQKLYMFKILKTICNFVQSTVPSVPVFRLNIKS